MRRVHRHGEAPARHRLVGRRVEQRCVDHTVFQRARQYAVAAGLRRLGPPIGPSPLRRLRQGDQKGRLGGR
jgi:hypothetical protein